MDLNPKDYRAWYGLGQTYELLHMPVYALHYYQRATQVACRPCPASAACPRPQSAAHGGLRWYIQGTPIPCKQLGRASLDMLGAACQADGAATAVRSCGRMTLGSGAPWGSATRTSS